MWDCSQSMLDPASMVRFVAGGSKIFRELILSVDISIHAVYQRVEQMLQRLFFLAMCVSIISPLRAQEAHREWLKLLKGDWTYEITNPADKGSVTYNPAAKQSAMIAHFTSEDGSRSVELGGWKSETSTFSVSGYGSDGAYWQLDFTTVLPDRLEGPHFSFSDGTKYTGIIKLKKVNENQFEWTSSGKDGSGNDVIRSGVFKRKTE